MKFKKTPGSTVGWFVLSLIPIANLYFMWKTAKLIANTEYERGD
ncbi:MAG: hypothetical protein ABIJ92_05410 [Candidatus Aenigmatarchaeota archaeon]